MMHSFTGEKLEELGRLAYDRGGRDGLRVAEELLAASKTTIQHLKSTVDGEPIRVSKDSLVIRELAAAITKADKPQPAGESEASG